MFSGSLIAIFSRVAPGSNLQDRGAGADKPGMASVISPRRPRRLVRVVAGTAFSLLMIATVILAGQRLTHTSWPLQKAKLSLVGVAAVCYFASYVFRALGWRRLFPDKQRPGRARCLASCGAAAASGVVLPFRLDYLVKIGTLRKLGGVRVGLEAVGFSIVLLGLVDAVAFLPLSISATATTTSSFRVPMLVVVSFGVICFGVLFAGSRIQELPLAGRSARFRRFADRFSGRTHLSRSTGVACLFLFGCWTTRAIGSATLLTALGVRFSPALALVVLCLGAAAAVLPVTSGGAVANVSATAAVLLALGVSKEAAINFGLASGMMLAGTALAAAIVGVAVCLSLSVRTRMRPATL